MLRLRRIFCAFPLCCCQGHTEDGGGFDSSKARIGRWYKRTPSQEAKAKEEESPNLEIATNETVEEPRLGSKTSSMPKLRDPAVSLQDQPNDCLETTIRRKTSWPNHALIDHGSSQGKSRPAVEEKVVGSALMLSKGGAGAKDFDQRQSLERVNLSRSLPFAEVSSSSVLTPECTKEEGSQTPSSDGIRSTTSRMTVFSSSSPHVTSAPSSPIQSLEPVIFRDRFSVRAENAQGLPDFSTFIVPQPGQVEGAGSSHQIPSTLLTGGVQKSRDYSPKVNPNDDNIEAWLSSPESEVSYGSSVLELYREAGHSDFPASSLYHCDVVLEPAVETLQSENFKPALTEPMKYTPPAKSHTDFSRPKLAVCTWHASNGRAYVQQLKNIDEAEKKISKKAWLNMMMNQFGLDGQADCFGLMSMDANQGLVQRREKSQP